MKSYIFPLILVVSFVGILVYDSKYFCDEINEVHLGKINSVQEIATSFNDSHRMQITVNDENGYAGIYYIRGLTNARLGQDIYMVDMCGNKKIKLNDKLFGTYE